MSLAPAFEFHDRLPSTSDRAIALAQQGAPPWTAVLAREQTAGRGRHGRRWLGGPGNLFLSVVLDPRVAPLSAWWSFAAAVATVESLSPWLDDPAALRLKWPNDLFLNGAKAGGILIEAGGSKGSEGSWVVAGIGVNLVHAPVDAGQATIALAARAPMLPPVEQIAGAIVRGLQAWAAVLAEGGLAALLSTWQSYANAPGTPLTVRLARTTLQGRYLGLGADGALLLEAADGTRHRIVVGEVL